MAFLSTEPSNHPSEDVNELENKPKNTSLDEAAIATGPDTGPASRGANIDDEKATEDNQDEAEDESKYPPAPAVALLMVAISLAMFLVSLVSTLLI